MDVTKTVSLFGNLEEAEKRRQTRQTENDHQRKLKTPKKLSLGLSFTRRLVSTRKRTGSLNLEWRSKFNVRFCLAASTCALNEKFVRPDKQINIWRKSSALTYFLLIFLFTFLAFFISIFSAKNLIETKNKSEKLLRKSICAVGGGP